MSVENIIKLDLFYKDADHSDVEFIVKNRNGDTINFPAHRSILMAQSQVFECMFAGGLKEGSSVAILDVSAEAFEEFMQLFYLGELTLTTENLAEVLRLVDKYDVVQFWPTCEAFMEQTLTESVAYHYYELVLSFSLSDDTRNKVETVICKNPKLVFETSTMGTPNSKVLAVILQIRQLMGKEIDLFDGVMTWLKAALHQQNRPPTVECIKEELGECLSYFRFPLMTKEEMLKCFEEYPSLLPPNQCAELLEYAASKKTMTAAARFNCEKRYGMYNKYVIEFVPIEFPDPRRLNDTNSANITMRWTNDYAMDYTVELYICEEYIEKRSRDANWLETLHVGVLQNKKSVSSQGLKVCRGTVKLTEPISFRKRGDTISVSIYLSDRSFYYMYKRAVTSSSLLPDGLIIEKGELEHPVLAVIHLTEAMKINEPIAVQ